MATVLQSAYLTISKSADPGADNYGYQVGESFAYYIMINNTSTAPLTDMFITDILPLYGQLLSTADVVGQVFTGPDGSGSGSVANLTTTMTVNPDTTESLNVNIGSQIPVGGSLEVVVPVVVAAGAPWGQLLPNIATVDCLSRSDMSATSDPLPTTRTPVVKAPDLEVTKTSNVSVVSIGGTFYYTITITNVGNGNSANPVVISDDLPSGLILNGDATSSLGKLVNTGTNTSLNLEIDGTLTPGESETVMIPVVVTG